MTMLMLMMLRRKNEQSSLALSLSSNRMFNDFNTKRIQKLDAAQISSYPLHQSNRIHIVCARFLCTFSLLLFSIRRNYAFTQLGSLSLNVCVCMHMILLGSVTGFVVSLSFSIRSYIFIVEKFEYRHCLFFTFCIYSLRCECRLNKMTKRE